MHCPRLRTPLVRGGCAMPCVQFAVLPFVLLAADQVLLERWRWVVRCSVVRRIILRWREDSSTAWGQGCSRVLGD